MYLDVVISLEKYPIYFSQAQMKKIKDKEMMSRKLLKCRGFPQVKFSEGRS